MDDQQTARRACALISLRSALAAKAGLKTKLRDRTATERHRAGEGQVIHRRAAPECGHDHPSIAPKAARSTHATPHRTRQPRRPPTARRAISPPRKGKEHKP